MKTRKSQSDLNLKDIAETYGPLLQQDFSVDVAAAGTPVLEVPSFGRRHLDMIALQKTTFALAKKHQRGDIEEVDELAVGDTWAPSSDAQPAEPELVPLPLAMQGPAAVAWKLLTDATCMEEQIDAVACLASAF